VSRLFVTVVLGLLGALLAGASPASAEDAPPAADTTQPADGPPPPRFTYNGPVGNTLDDTDRVFLRKVRQAGMWERPSGQMAQRKGSSARTKEVGKLIEADHTNLDEDVTKAAQRLGVEMPTEPTPEQSVWLTELEAANGQDFDAKFAQLLRDAHGAVFQLIANIRANSRNNLVRAFAAHANEVVHRHMQLLESTNNVAYDKLPKAKGSVGRTRPYKQEPMFVLALIAIAGVVGFTGVMRAIRA
jgi:predicted outer membrane protein